MTTIQITLPDQLAREAQSPGLLSLSRLEGWLREQLKAQQIEGLFAAINRMAAVPEPAAMTPEEMAADERRSQP